MQTKWFLPIAFTVVSCALYGQAGTGGVAGRVVDPTGASVPNAAVTATNLGTHEMVRTLSTAAGSYEFVSLLPGEYSIAAEAAGFKRLERPNVTVRVGDRLTINLDMQVGQTSDSITVSGDAPLLRTEDAQEGDVIDQAAIMNLPVLNHDPLELVRLSSDFQGSGSKNDPENRINGGRPIGMEYFVDGIAIETGVAHKTVDNTPTMQGTAEFKVVTNGISAEYGRMSGGFVEVVTKSGTNEYHGQLFEYDQNRIFNANSWGNNSLGQPKGLFQYNLFGGAVGGPIWIPKIYSGRNKTFFYFDYQKTIYNAGGIAQTGSVPTEAMRQGDMSGVQVQGTSALLYDQNSPIVCATPTGTSAYGPSCEVNSTATQDLGGPARSLLIGDGKHVPQSLQDPFVVATWKMLPMPNRAADPNCSYCNNYIGTYTSKNNDARYSGRIDEVLTSNQRLFGRFTFQDYNGFPSTRWLGPLQPTNETIINGGNNFTTDYTWTKSPTTIIEARGGFYFNPLFSGNGVDPSVVPNIPVDPLIQSLMGPGNLPWAHMQANDSQDYVSGPGAGNNITNNTVYQANLSMTKILARHTLKFGYEHRRYYDNNSKSGNSWFIASGNTTKRFAYDNNGTPEASADAPAAYLMGQADMLTAQGFVTNALNYNYHAAFVQDDFKVSPKLTLNLGLRWEVETPLTERHDNLFFWDPKAPSPFTLDPSWNWNAQLQAAGVDPSTVPEPDWAKNGKFPNGAIVAAGTPEHPSRYGPGYNWGQFAPRFGVAWQMTPKTVLRASAGEMYLSSSGNAAMDQQAGSGFVQSNALNVPWHWPNTLPLQTAATFSHPLVNPSELITYTKNSAQANFQETGGQNLPVLYSLKSHAPREVDWNFSVQRELTQNFLVEVQYNGNRGVGLFLPNDISRFPSNLFTGGGSAASLYSTNIVSPIGNVSQTNWCTGSTPCTQQLAYLEYPYPQYGPIRLLGYNGGKSLYNAFVIRTEKRFSKGISFLGSYTWSRVKDNTGGPNTGIDITNSSGTGGREVQSTQLFQNDYTISPIDHTHRLVFAGNVDLPFGKGRMFLNNPQGVGKVLDYVVGGWQLAGIYNWTSGAPIVIGIQNSQVNNGYGRLINTWGSWATSNHSLAGSTSDYGKLLVNQGNTAQSATNRILNPDAIVPAQVFQLGDFNPVYPGIRQPGAFNTDLSLMKNFPFSEGKRYFQLRAEASNAFNQRGYPSINTTLGDPGFGQLVLTPGTSPKNPRNIQLSGRIVF